MLYVWGNGKNTTLLSLEHRVQQTAGDESGKLN